MKLSSVHQLARDLGVTDRTILNHIKRGTLLTQGRLGTGPTAPYIIADDEYERFIAWYRLFQQERRVT
jgi:hypothetical protein